MGMVKEYTCPDCGKPCDAIKCDSGLGPIEVWGRKSWDSQPYTGSDCCEAELEDAETSGFEDDGDYEYDCKKDREAEER